MFSRLGPIYFLNATLPEGHEAIFEFIGKLAAKK